MWRVGPILNPLHLPLFSRQLAKLSSLPPAPKKKTLPSMTCRMVVMSHHDQQRHNNISDLKVSCICHSVLQEHTLGVAEGQFFLDHLYNFLGMGLPDPNLDPTYRSTP